MPRPSRRGFARLLRRLDGPSLVSFVAALWAARGRSVRTVDGRIVATAPDGRETVIALHRGSRGWPSDADVIVTTTTDAAQSPATESETRVFGPSDLRNMVLYGIDRERADQLFRRFFDRPLEAHVGESARRLPRIGVTVAVVLSIVLVVAGVALPPGTGTAPSGPEGGDRATGGVPTSATPRPPSPTDPDPQSIAPGLTPTGVSDVHALATAHANALEGTSYTWRITYREHGRVDRFRLVAGRTELVTVANERRYRSSVYAWGSLHSVSPTVGASVYANGTARHTRPVTLGDRGNDTADASVRIEPVYPSGDYFSDRAARYVQWYLSANQTAVRAWNTSRGTSYLVTAEGTTYPRAHNYTAMALVNATGFVRQLRVEYEIPETQVAVIVTFRYTDLGETTVEPPEWVRGTKTDAGPATTETDTDPAQGNASLPGTDTHDANDPR